MAFGLIVKFKIFAKDATMEVLAFIGDGTGRREVETGSLWGHHCR